MRFAHTAYLNDIFNFVALLVLNSLKFVMGELIWDFIRYEFYRKKDM